MLPRSLLVVIAIAGGVASPAAAQAVRILPEIDTFLSSPRPDGKGDGVTTCCNANPVPDGELISSHNVMEVDTNQGGNGPVEPLMWFNLQPALLDRFAATPNAEATIQLTIVNGFDPLTVRRVTQDWISISGGGPEISRGNFPGAPADLSISAYVPGANIEDSATTVPDPAVANQVSGTTAFEVTADVLAWISGEPNYGWAFSPGDTQGGTIVAVENEDIPLSLVEGIGADVGDLEALQPALLLTGPAGAVLPHPFSGDFNRDGAVDNIDFDFLLSNFGEEGKLFEDGDNNFDGFVDFRDFIEFRRAFQGEGFVPAPEPSAVVLGWIVVGWLAVLRIISSFFTKKRYAIVAAIVVLSASIAERAMAQSEFEWQVDDGPWTEAANWLNPIIGSEVPDGVFGDYATIGNGGTAHLGEAAPPVAGLFVEDGALAIEEGAALEVIAFEPDLAGDAGTGAQGVVSIANGGGLSVVGDFINLGEIELGGPDANLRIEGGWRGGGSLTPHITAAGAPRVAVGGVASLSGVVSPTFEGVTPQLGDTWEILEASEIVGEFSLESDALEPGLILESVVDDGTVAVKVVNTLALMVNGVTGAMSISNPIAEGEAFDLTGYRLQSKSGQLSVGGFAGLENGGVEGWRAANLSPEQLAELNAASSRVLAAGDSFGLGAGFGADIQSPEEGDLFFTFTTSDGRLLAGTVSYEFTSPVCLTGDYDCNGVVDLIDFNLLKDNFGGPDDVFAAGSSNADGVIDLLDFNDMKANFGASAAIPEPGGLSLLALGLLFACGGRLRRTGERCNVPIQARS